MDNQQGRELTALLSRNTVALAPRDELRKLIETFWARTNSWETRRAYQRVVREFVSFARPRNLAGIEPGDIISWRDALLEAGRKPATVVFKLSVIRAWLEYLRLEGVIARNPAATRYVRPPAIPDGLRGRALAPKEVRDLLAGPDRRTPEGARDYALVLVMVRLSLRVAEACGLRLSSIRRNQGRWILSFKVKGGRERTVPLPVDVREAILRYLELDAERRHFLGIHQSENTYIFLPVTNYRNRRFDKCLSTTMAWYLVRKWGSYAGLGNLSPHDLRRTAITRALNQGLTLRQVQMMSGHRDPRTLQRYDHDRENLDQNAINFLSYE